MNLQYNIKFNKILQDIENCDVTPSPAKRNTK